MNGADIDLTDVQLLLPLFLSTDPRRRPPWCWALLDPEERAALTRICTTWIVTYNWVLATTPEELIPPCWLKHAGLASEVPVQAWLWFAAHMDFRASPVLASDYYGRHLVGFRTRVDRWLGRTPMECRKGRHEDTWRKPADDTLSGWPETDDESGDHTAVEVLGGLHYGFPR